MLVYRINFNTAIFKLEVDVHKIEYNNLDEQYERLLELLEAEGLDVIDYNENIAILVDDRGFEKLNNPIFDVRTEENISCQLAGKLVFVRNVYNEYSTDFGGLTPQDILFLKENLLISLKGLLERPF